MDWLDDSAAISLGTLGQEKRMSTTFTEPRDDAQVLVCSKCLCACCWYGEFMCDDATVAGTTVKTVAELRALDREHWEFWSDEKLTEIYGDATREFTP